MPPSVMSIASAKQPSLLSAWHTGCQTAPPCGTCQAVHGFAFESCVSAKTQPAFLFFAGEVSPYSYNPRP
jgi:hypothetical protein